MEMELTVTTNLQRSTIKDANGARMHNAHDPHVKHDNVQILPEYTHLNRHVVLLDRDELLNEQYGAIIKERNEKTRQRFLDGKIGLSEYKSRVTNVKKYLNIDGKTPKQALTNYVFTLGNVDTEFELLDKLGYEYERQKVKDANGTFHDRPKLTNPAQAKEFADLMSETYINLAKQINQVNAGIKIVDVWVHMDEGGVPHAQGEIVNMGHTTTGKPSYNLNQAIGEFNKKSGYDDYNGRSVNGRLALKHFREAVDYNMLKCFNNALKQRGYDLQVSMVRLGRKGGLSMPEYQANQQMRHDLEGTYKAVVGDQAKPQATPLEMAQSVSKHLKQAKKEHEDTAQQVTQLKAQAQGLDQQVKQHQRYLRQLREKESKVSRYIDDVIMALTDGEVNDLVATRIDTHSAVAGQPIKASAEREHSSNDWAVRIKRMQQALRRANQRQHRQAQQVIDRGPEL